MECPSESPESLNALKQEIHALRDELHRFIERTNQIHLNTIITDLRNEYTGLLATHQVERASDCLKHGMVQECTMHDTCFQVFLDFLTTTSRHIAEGKITDELIEAYSSQLDDLRKKGPYEKCDTCFAEVRRLLSKQLDLMRSLGLLNQQESGDQIPEIPDEEIVAGIIEPIASTTRFSILQAVSVSTKTFSDLSHLTTLRGGNLLFHLKKLQEAGMIIQRHERGDYFITEKGFRTLTAIRDLYITTTGSDIKINEIRREKAKNS